MTAKTAIILIGRNEGARLLACLASLPQGLGEVIYVDSGSTDGSIEAAKEAGAHVVELDTSIPFTAARARNAGVDAITEPHDYLQFIDGDCAFDPDWIATAMAFLDTHADVAVVCGRRREKFPDASIYNKMCDVEWDTPIGEAKACGGDAMMRREVFEAVGGFNPTLIAGEEPELCVRIRGAGWKVWRLDAEMTSHDADMTRLSQYWKRSRRGGHAYAEGAYMHGAPPERHSVPGTRRAVLWGGVIPAFAAGMTLLVWPFGLLVWLIYPIQIARLAMRDGGTAFAWKRAALLTLGKFAEMRGVLEFHSNRLLGRDRTLIEYK